ncbi:MAG TPA: AraC family transcriptional regulator [Candidatus Sulfotelmatobacter sp.]|nr:AraC family transcriptional regulator [Candidatus Sulfotelmatobacter sp.]
MASPVVRDSTLRSHCESVERVITAMHNQIDRPMTLQEMARIGFASPYHFNRTFRQITGVPPLQFLYALRLDAAKRLLTETQKKVIDICYEVGYNSVGTFTRRFADVLGVSPTHLRKLAQDRRTSSVRRRADQSHGRRERSGARLEGRILAPENFRGLVAVGLFNTPIPHSKPVSCAILKSGGTYLLETVPEGEFYLFAVGLMSPANGSACFDHANALRAGGQPIRISRNSVLGDTTLALRPPSPFDPPVLLVIPQEKLPLM